MASDLISVYRADAPDYQETFLFSKTLADCPSWSPANQEIIAIVRLDSGQDYRLSLFNRDGQWERDLYKSASYLRGAVWSPDGQKIVFIERGKLAMLDIASDNLTTLQKPLPIPIPGSDVMLESELLDPSWAPDGRFIIYTEDYAGRCHCTKLWSSGPLLS